MRYWDGAKWLEIAPPPAATATTDAPPTDDAQTSSDAVPAESAAEFLRSSEQEGPAKKRGVPWWGWTLIAVGVIAVVIIVGSAIAPKTPTTAAAKSPSAAAESPAAADTPEPEYTPSPAAPEEGSLENPWPAGHTAHVTKSDAPYYSVSAKLVSSNANQAMKDANQFNDPAPAGSHYVLVEYTFTGEGDDSVDPGVESFDWQVADQDGHVYQSESAVTPGNDLSGAPELYKGQVYTGQEAYIVPDSTTTLYVSALGKYIALQ
jgi:hypothetical protein